MCPTCGLAVSFLSIYKMFPADKKRVESALASAHLPKGKVRKYQHFNPYILLSPDILMFVIAPSYFHLEEGAKKMTTVIFHFSMTA